jgi:hypothetical protein
MGRLGGLDRLVMPTDGPAMDHPEARQGGMLTPRPIPAYRGACFLRVFSSAWSGCSR